MERHVGQVYYKHHQPHYIQEDVMPLLQRYWINAPSTFDVCHHWNGKNVITDKDDIGYPNTERLATVYFTDGNIISAYVPKIYLAKGWRKPKNIKD